MSASIVLSDLSWSTPDGRPLFSHLDLTFGAERTGLVGRNGVGKSTLLAMIAGERQPRSGTISVGGSFGLLRQSVRAEPGETIAGLFGATEALAVLRRAEAGEADADEIAAADWMLETRIAAALAKVGLDAAAQTPLAALSGGQRTRAGLAALVFGEPDFLILDEPTNDLDRDGRAAVIELVAGWQAGAIIVSHDRELLETVDAIVELTSLGATRYGGNWSGYRERRAVELAAARHDLAAAEKRAGALADAAQLSAERQARRDGAGRRQAAKGGVPRIALGGAKQRSEATGGEKARLAERRRSEALEAAAAARGRIEVLEAVCVRLAPTGLPPNRIVLALDRVTAGHVPGKPVLLDLSFTVTGPERIAVTGPNGAGKTTLLALVAGTLAPWRGTMRVTTAPAMLDQRVSLLDPAMSIRDNFRRINPQADENACRAALARFMFRADAALQMVATLSGGQMLRAGLACVLGGSAPPGLLILDEPTNHLDIEAIAAVEAGLRAYDGALLVVSHDEAFLDAIGISRRLELSADRG
ncbi:ABC-F family ATP-binding cassette domain-containing protein [Labrys monachus]|uniref:ATPase subunit of ABC transporter with duplicated ATPase domains n=1 Tax=Labrys monachus TaxID=217067 RepID=A0ABU0FBZ1_9HYPH|nr:ABC-F family ATP-binding cassette domain-containing protein [Labrys monachus]MDQ0391608.1 ATPase subunit of ABC transporter with duplicated ATPase domains [Labrys monachus]